MSLNSALLQGDLPLVAQFLLQDSRFYLRTRYGRFGYTVLHTASEEGFEDAVTLILRKFPELNVDDVTTAGITPLFLACKFGHARVVQALLEIGHANADLISESGFAALATASEHNHIDVVRLLIEKGHANVNLEWTKEKGVTPLYLACQNGHETIVKILLEHHAEANQGIATSGATPLYVASQNGHAAVVKALLDIAHVTPDKSRVTDSASPLSAATCLNRIEVAELLLKAGANPHHIARGNHSPLEIACLRDELEIVQAMNLIGHADLNREGGSGLTPLFVACRAGRFRIVEYLLNSGVKVCNKACLLEATLSNHSVLLKNLSFFYNEGLLFN